MAVRYLETLLKGTGLEIDIVGTASNGVRAVPEILRLRPDFVFADISMPVMDGLQMAEKVFEHNPAQKIFILTAYKDFEYAKKSVRIGVTDYLLKNELSEQGLEKLICGNGKEIVKERQRRHTLMESNLRKFLLTESFPNEKEDWIYQDRPLQRYLLFYVAPRPLVVLQHRETGQEGQEEHIESYGIEQALTGSELTCRAFIEMFHGEYCGIFFAAGNVGNIDEKCRKIGKDIMERFGQTEGRYLCLISGPEDHFSRLPAVYARLRRKREFLYAEAKEIYQEAEIPLKERKKEYADLELWNAQWEALLQEGEIIRAEHFLEKRLKDLRESLDIWEYTEKIQQIYRRLEAFLKKKTLDPQILSLNPFYTNTEELEQDLIHAQTECLYAQEKRRTQNYSRYTLSALEYIHTHYTQDISVAEIAEAAGISEGHLRRCFKSEMDTNIVSYLVEYRINKAKKIMDEGKTKRDDVWKKTGFTSAQYFSYAFKKKEGITPREYMRMEKDE